MSERITINLTEPKEEIKFTLTDQSEEVVFSFSEAARGPQGEPGSSVTVDQTIIDGSTNAVSGNAVFDGLALKAPIANPTFTGIVTAPRIAGRCDGLEVLCKAGLAISAGQVVYVTGASGNNIIIGLAQANAELTSSKTIGISESTLANNGTGYVITEGLLTVSISAPTAVEGDPIWLSPTTAGGMVFGAANKPVAPNHMVYLGVVTRKTGNTVVEIFVKVQNGSELDELSDVLITSPTAGQALMRGASLWENRSLVSADISDATENATPNTIVKRGTQGGAAFAGTNGIAISATSTTATAVSAVSTNSTAVYGESGSSDGGFFGSIFGTGLSTYTDAGDYHAKFGPSSGDNRSFVARVSGAFGWWRGAFRGFLQAPASITGSDKTWTLPNNTGTVALTTDAMTPTAHASSHVTGGTDKIRDASAAQDGLMTTTFAAKLNGIEAGADVTDATNVNAAGAVMESDYSPSHSILVQQSGTGSPSSLSIGNNTLVGRLSGGGSAIDDLSASQVRTLLNVEDGADVTDAANVASTITGAAAKTTLVDADETVLTDSAASFGLKRVTWLNVWNYIVSKIGAITSITAGGAWSFSSTTRPTSSGTGTPAATSLITRSDFDTRNALVLVRGLYNWSNTSSTYSSSHTGTGSAGTNTDVLDLTTGIVAGSVSFLRSNIFAIRNWQVANGSARATVNWSLRTVYSVRISTNGLLGGSDTVVRLLLGQVITNTTAQDLTSANRGIGFKIVDGLVSVQVANGTTLTTTSTATTISGTTDHDLQLDCDGAGNWVAYINGSSVATGTGAPTGNSTATHNALQMSLTNGTTAANRQFYIVNQNTLQI
jgi:hypothetical protein